MIPDYGFQTGLPQPAAQPPTAVTPAPATPTAPTSPPVSSGMSVAQFGDTIKTKYPQYTDLDSATLGQKMLTKYPQYSDMVTTPNQQVASPPSALQRIGSNLAQGSIGQELIGIGKGAAQTVAGIGKFGMGVLDQTLGRGINAIEGKGFSAPIENPQVINSVDSALQTQGPFQGIGKGLEKTAELLAPTKIIDAGKAAIGGIEAASTLSKVPIVGEALAKGLSTVQDIPYLGKALSYAGQKVLNALPEMAFGTTYGLSQGEAPKEALKTGGTFGILSGVGEVVGDTWRAIKGNVVDNITKAIGATGKMTPQQALDRIPKSLNAFQTMANLAGDIKVKTAEGVEKAWEPTKDGFYEGLQALQQTKQKVYDAYTELAQQAGSQGAKMTAEDFQKVISDISAQGKDATSSFRSKVSSLVDDLKQNFGTYNQAGEFQGFKDTELPRIQKFIEKVNTDVNPLSDKAGATVSDTASKSLRKLMDSKIEDATFLSDVENKQLPGQKSPYQGLRNTYSDLKSIENDMVNQLKKTYRGVGGRVGQYVEGFGSLDTILGALSHNPIETARGVGMAGLGKLMNYLRDPSVAMQNAFGQLTGEEAGPLSKRILGQGTEPPTMSPEAQQNINRIATPPSSMGTEESSVIKQAVDLTNKNGGVTINLKGEIPTEGFSVATSKATEKVLPVEELNLKTATDYVKQNFDVLKNNPNAHIGMWVDNGKVYFDVPSVFTDKVEAVKAAKAADQLGIFDLKNFETIGKDKYEEIIANNETATQRNSGGIQSANVPESPTAGTSGRAGQSQSPISNPTGIVKNATDRQQVIDETIKNRSVSPTEGQTSLDLPKKKDILVGSTPTNTITPKQRQYISDLTPEQKTAYLNYNNKTAEVYPQFKSSVQDMADQVGVKAKISRKGDPRAIEKAIDDYGGDFTKVTDLNRAAFSAKTVEDTKKLTDLVNQNFDVVTTKNRIENPTNVGYRDMMFKVRMPNGTQAEIQILLPEMEKAKSALHGQYEITRKLDNKIFNAEATPKQYAEWKKAFNKQVTGYTDAWNRQLASQ